MTTRENKTSEEWTAAKSITFVSACSEFEAHTTHEQGEDGVWFSADAAWGRYYIIEDVIMRMEKAINGKLEEVNG